MAAKSQRSPPSRRHRTQAKKTLKKHSAAKRPSKADPVHKPPAELTEPPRATKKPVKDPLPGGDPFDL